MTIHIRAMTPADLPRVLALWDNVPEVELNDADTPEKLRAYLERNPELSPVATSAGEIVSAALCGHDGLGGYLHHLAVTPDHRKYGLGKTLVAYYLTHLSNIGYAKCNIFVSPENGAGLAFWHRQGFEEKPWTFLQRNNDGA